MKTTRHPTNCPTRQGFVLLAILVFIFLLSMITLSLLFRSQGDENSGWATAGSEQAWSAAMSGVGEAVRVAAASAPGATDWQDDPNLFRGRAVYLDGTEQWSFTVFSPADADALVDTRYGLSDEASRLNLNHPGDADLSKIPRVTAPLATAMRQFIGLDPQQVATPDQSVPTPTPLPVDPLAFTDTPLLPANPVTPHGPLATLDELLLLPGLTRAILHGAPPVLDDQAAPPTPINLSGPQLPLQDSKPKADRGLDQYFTVFSRDPSRSGAGQRRCNLNDAGDPLPAADWPAGFSNYVAAVRTAKLQLASPSDVLEATVKVPDDHGAEVEVASEITKENLPLVLDLLTTDKENGHDGLVNVNTASAAVLATLPGIDQPLAESIVSTRAGLSPERRATIAWLYQESVVDAAKFKSIAPRLTARSTQFRFNVIGYGLPSGRYRVLEAVIDLAGTDPRVVYLRDITRLGLPISLKQENPADPNARTASVPMAGPRNHFPPHG